MQFAKIACKCPRGPNGRKCNWFHKKRISNYQNYSCIAKATPAPVTEPQGPTTPAATTPAATTPAATTPAATTPAASTPAVTTPAGTTPAATTPAATTPAATTPAATTPAATTPAVTTPAATTPAPTTATEFAALSDKITAGLQTCGSTTRIVNGVDADANSWPWIVNMSFQDASMVGGGSAFLCGGTIINDEWILTAAHCCTDNVSNLPSYNRPQR